MYNGKLPKSFVIHKQGHYKFNRQSPRRHRNQHHGHNGRGGHNHNRMNKRHRDFSDTTDYDSFSDRDRGNTRRHGNGNGNRNENDKFMSRYNSSRTGYLGYTVWIGNIPKHVTKSHIVKVLEEYGDILSIYLLNQTRNPYNCAFVDFASPQDVIAVGRGVYSRKLKIYDKSVSAVLRERTSYVFVQYVKVYML